MKFPFWAKIAWVYLLLVAIVSSAMGIFAFAGGTYSALQSGQIEALSEWFSWRTALAPLASPSAFWLAIGVSIGGILGIIALWQIERDVRWIYVWYGVAGLSLLVTLIGFVASTNRDGAPDVGRLIGSVLPLLATYILHKGTRFAAQHLSTNSSLNP